MPSLRPTQPKTLDEQAAAELVERKLAAPVFVDVVVPRTNVAGRMRLVTRAERLQAHADTRRFLEKQGFPIDASAASSLGAHEQWQYELGLRLLAAAVRHPEDAELPLASVDEWRECDDDQIDALYTRLEDLRAEHDPLGAGELTREDVTAIIAAAKKKDAAVLMSFGSRKLALFAITSVEPLASSTTSPS
jgi:hypothetical protein